MQSSACKSNAERGVGGAVMGLGRNPDRDGALELGGRRDGYVSDVAATTGGYPLSLHDALPISAAVQHGAVVERNRHGDGVVAVFEQAAGVGQRDGEVAGAVLKIGRAHV